MRTPTRHSRTLSGIAGCEVWLKFENRQFTASFKERGALNRILSLSEDERRRGVAAMSAGNHAQGVAYHAGRLGIPATIVMPVTTPFNKVKHTRDFGATVIQHGRDLIEADAEARRIAQEQGLTFIHPYDDPLVIAGQGTLRAGDAGRRAAARRPDRAGGRRRVDLRLCHRGQRHQARASKSSARRASFIRRCSMR